MIFRYYHRLGIDLSIVTAVSGVLLRDCNASVVPFAEQQIPIYVRLWPVSELAATRR